MTSNAALPLHGIRVVEFTHMVMGPSMGLILADLGADVVKVEPLDGDNTRRLTGAGAGYFAMYNRNKSSLAIDLKSQAGHEAVLRLVDQADVVIENFRPGAMDARGLGADAIRARNPGAIYCSGKGFLSGPYAHRTALDEVAQMMGGLAYMTGLPDRPMRAGASVIDVTGALFGVIGILAALVRRQATGRGEQIATALYETTAFLVGQHIAQFAVTGTAPPPMSQRQSAWAVYDIFESREGERVFVAVVTDTQWRRFCEAFGLERFVDDPQLASNNDRVMQRERVIPVVTEALRTFSKVDLMARLEDIGLPFAPVARPQDLVDDPHLNAGGLLEVSVAGGTVAKLPALPIEMGGHRFGLRSGMPEVGDGGAEALRAAGYSAQQIEALAREGVVRLGTAADS
ncbi:CoA transferase [Ramlibacter sp. AW1]|uniref:CoA transferase n=1 Tax=Ramlibacter aurantiacus TaxID=2801330 RepID=A0A937D494_9BURK|nr:CaiB/BaiF CoA-transferase family protein [Ramlibacter aurantiacus]MBL0421505.1 CoA transferase [Ramlibacter aurantiacus]